MSEFAEELESSVTESGRETVISDRNLMRKYPVEVLSHWEHGFPEMQASSQAMYEEIEAGIRALELPGVVLGRTRRSQGGFFSSKREYLLIRRERILIEVCAAPFGPKFFFVSWRLSMILILFDFFSVFGGFFASIAIGWSVAQFTSGGAGFLWGAILFFIVMVLKAADFNELLADLQTVLLRTPVVGQYWGLFVKPETYYQIDSAAAFRGAVHKVVLDVVGGLIEKHGGSPLTIDERKPILASLFGRR